MTKKQLLAILTISTLALAQAGIVSADETTTSPVAGTIPVVVSPDGAPVDQVQLSQPVEISIPSAVTKEPVYPTTPTPSMPFEEPKSDDSTQPSGELTVSSDGNDQTTPAPTNPSTGEVPRDVKLIPEPVETVAPFKTPSGVIGIQNSQVSSPNTDGSTQTVKAEDMGVTTNYDGTVTLPTAPGEAKNLPQTGEKGSILSTIGLGILSLVGVIVKKKTI